MHHCVVYDGDLVDEKGERVTKWYWEMPAEPYEGLHLMLDRVEVVQRVTWDVKASLWEIALH